jgi:hypothetical protein
MGFMVRRTSGQLPAAFAAPDVQSDEPDDAGSGTSFEDEDDALPRRTSNPFARPRGKRA